MEIFAVGFLVVFFVALGAVAWRLADQSAIRVIDAALGGQDSADSPRGKPPEHGD